MKNIFDNVSSVNLFSEFGEDFQKRSILVFLKNPNLFRFIDSSLDIFTHFDYEHHRYILQVIKNHIKFYSCSPSWSDLIIYYKQIPDTQYVLNTKVPIKDLVKSLLIELKEMDSANESLAFVENTIYNFFRHKIFKQSIDQSIDHLKRGEYDEIYSKISSARSFDINYNIGSNYISTLDRRLEKYRKDTIPTGWLKIDSLLEGGSGKGEFYIIITPPGGGKTWFLCNIGAKAAISGFKVLHFSLELYEDYTSLRYDSVMTKIPLSNLKFKKNEVMNFFNSMNIKPDIRVVSFSPMSLTPQKMRSVIDNLALSGFSPDVIVVDYADLMKPDSDYMQKKEYRHSITTIYYSLKAIAADYKVALWTASQSNRQSVGIKVITAYHVAEDFNKIAIGDFVISCSYSPEMSKYNYTIAFVIKNRFGKDQIQLPGVFDKSNGECEFYDANESKGMAILSEIEQIENGISEVDKKYIQNKYKIRYEEEFFNKSEGLE